MNCETKQISKYPNQTMIRRSYHAITNRSIYLHSCHSCHICCDGSRHVAFKSLETKRISDDVTGA